MQQLLLDLSQPPPPTLTNFAVGGNAEPLHALHTWLRGAVHERCIYLWGASGCDKTHILRALVQAAHELGRTEAYSRPEQVEALDALAEVPTLIALDDVERLSEQEQAALFRLFQRATETDTLLLVSADTAPAALTLREDLRTRLASGLTFQMHLLSDDEKAKALAAHAAQRGFGLAPEVAQYLLQRRQRDLPALMQVLDALDQHSLRTQRPITLALLREVLQEDTAPRPS